MNARKHIFIFTSLVYCSHAFGNFHARCSVAIPCYWKHFKYLPDVLESLSRQTLLPAEVVIACSEIEKVDPSALRDLEAADWPFPIKITYRSGFHSEGSNRTFAAIHCKEPIVCCIDADDYAHPQRLEAICKTFVRFPFLNLILTGHAYCPDLSKQCCSAIPWFSRDAYQQLRFDLEQSPISYIHEKSDLQNWETGVHNGSPSFLRKVIDEGFFWTDLSNGADQQFNLSVVEANRFQQTKAALICLPLIHYFNIRTSACELKRGGSF